MPANILNLPQYRVLRVEESDHDYHVTAEPVDVTAVCPHCQSDRLTSWGTREQVFKDLPMHGKRVGIYIDTKLDLTYAFQREGNSLINLRESKELANLVRSRMYNVSFFSWLLFFVFLFLFLSSKL